MNRREFLVEGLALASAASRTVIAGEAAPQYPRTIRVGIIGFDGHYSESTDVAKINPNIQFTAISDPSSEVIQRVARSTALSSPRQVTDYHRLLAIEPLDVVAVCGEVAPRARLLQTCAERNLP